MCTGLLIDLVTGAIGTKAGDAALGLEELKLGLAELFFDFAKLAFNDSEFAVALLKHVVGRAEERELLLLVLRTGVRLLGDFAKLHFEFAERIARAGQPVFEAAAFGLRKVGLVFGSFLLGAKIVGGLLGVLDALVELGALGFFLVERALLGFEFAAAGVGLGAERSYLCVEFTKSRGERSVLVAIPREREVAHPVVEPFVAESLGGLAAEAADLARNLAHDIGDAREILVSERELTECFAALGFVFGNASGFLEPAP